MKFRTLIFYTLVGVVAGLIASWLVQPNDERQTLHKTVYEVCQMSRMYNGVGEDTCGDMQSVYGIEYICDHDGSDAGNHCWTEDNPLIGQELR